MDPMIELERPRYGTWIRLRRLYAFAVATVVTAVAAVLLTLLSPWFALLLVPAALFGYVVVVLAMTIWRLGPGGGDYRRRVHELIVRHCPTDAPGRALDIGCGSASLVVMLARAWPQGSVVGIDPWEQNWEYSMAQCERNAMIEAVADRTTFLRQSATSMAFDSDSFDTVVSCLTFHEVRDTADRTAAITEALRVLRPGGRFVFLDLFAEPRNFGPVQGVRAAITGAGAVVEAETRLGALVDLPFPLAGRRVLGRAVLITGTVGACHGEHAETADPDPGLDRRVQRRRMGQG